MKCLIDVRSDTVTTPTKEMVEAMMYAEVGDDILRDDPTVLRLESLAADILILGKEAAISTISGTQARPVDRRKNKQDTYSKLSIKTLDCLLVSNEFEN